MIQLTPDEVAAVVLARQNRRLLVTALTVMALLLWTLAVGMVILLAVNNVNRVMTHIPEVHIQYLSEDGRQDRTYHHQGRQLTPEELADLMYDQINGLSWTVPQLSATLLVFVAASLTTLAVVHAARRATLRQIQASLADISVQLADLKQRTATGPLPPV